VILAHAIARVLKTEKSWLEGGDVLKRAPLPLWSPRFPSTGAELLLQLVVAAATVGSWPLRVSDKASAAITIAAAFLWFPAPTASLMEGFTLIKH
jgi:hypothetical protein